MKISVSEIFSSIQGEGPYVGEKQCFVRFCACNLNCAYCDTDFSPKMQLNEEEFLNAITPYTLSLTGGEPLLQADFLQKVLPKIKNKIYLETNGTLPAQLAKIIDFVDVVAMDVKIESAANQPCRLDLNESFIQIARKKECFAKIVFNSKITMQEIENSAKLLKKYDILTILQPQMPLDAPFCTYIAVLDEYLKFGLNARLIGQTHKFFDVP